MPNEPTLLRVLITGRHWQKFEAFEAQFRKVAAELAKEHNERYLATASVSRRQFERWYAGNVKTAPHPDACRILERMFGCPVHDLLGSASQASSLAVKTGTLVPSSVTTSSENTDGNIHQPPTNDVSLSDQERIVAMATRRARRFISAADASNVGEGSLDELRAEVERLAFLYPQQPLSEIIGDIVELQDITFSLLEGRQRPRETRDLYVIGGLVSGMLAKAAHDLRDPHMAMTHSRTALLCAQNAEHSALTGWVRGIQSLTSYWAERPREAVEYAQLGAQVPGITGTVSVWLASLEARAWATLGNGVESQRMIEVAEGLRDRIAASDLDEIGGICAFSEARQLYYAADAGARLPEEYADTSRLHSRTEAYAASAIAAYANLAQNEISFGDEAGSRTDLAIARIRANDLDGASEALEPVIGLPVAQRIHGIVGSVINVHRAIAAKSPDTPIAEEIQESIEEYCRTPAAALPR